MNPSVELQALVLGMSQLKRSSAGRRRALEESLDGHTRVISRPVSPRLYRFKPARAVAPFDVLFGRHDLYHQAHLDMDPAVAGNRLVVTLHDVIAADWPDEGVFLDEAEHVLSRAAAVVTVSETSRSKILRLFPRVNSQRVHAIWNGVDHALFHARVSPEDAQLVRLSGAPADYLLYVGGISRRKNVATLVAGYHQLRHANADTPPLVLVGPWDSGRLRELLGKPLPSGVVPLGSVSQAAIPALMRSARALVAPSQDEGFGLPLLEAQACGAPVVCSDIPVFREVGGTSPVFVPPTALGLAEGMARVLEMTTTETAQRRIAGLAHAQDFTWDRTAERHLEVYQRVIGGMSDAG
jgi:glycosyltransferase involved in cell wall biosynthesis